MDRLSLESLFADEKIEVSCPVCNHDFMVDFKDVSNDRSVVQCPACNQDIEFVHDDTTKKTLNDSNKALKEFERTLKKFGK